MNQEQLKALDNLIDYNFIDEVKDWRAQGKPESGHIFNDIYMLATWLHSQQKKSKNVPNIPKEYFTIDKIGGVDFSKDLKNLDNLTTVGSTEDYKRDLLAKIEKKELARIDSLSFEKLQEMVDKWFGVSGPLMTNLENRAQMTNDYMNDYMAYQQDKGIEELQDLLQEIR